MINSTDIEKIKRFSKGISDAKEEKYVWALFSGKEGDPEFKQYIQNEFNEYFDNYKGKEYHLSFLIDRIHHNLNLRESQKKRPFIRKIYKCYSLAAAVLLIPLIIAGIFWQNNFSSEEHEGFVTNELVAPMGARISFSLPDGTTGWLNSGSSLKYQIPFCQNREVSLKGEARFDVVHDNIHPFELSAGDTKVKVWGTKFNVNSYPEEHSVEVVLAEGKVEFLVPEFSKSVIMKPNERLIYKNGAIHINVTKASKYMAWSEGKLVFRGDSMEEVVRRISRWYNVDVVLMDNTLKSYRIQGTFQDDPLKEVLTVLSMTSPIRYQIVDRKILKDGTFQKKKVLLYKN